jgi:hypothetical protein
MLVEAFETTENVTLDEITGGTLLVQIDVKGNKRYAVRTGSHVSYDQPPAHLSDYDVRTAIAKVTSPSNRMNVIGFWLDTGEPILTFFNFKVVNDRTTLKIKNAPGTAT